MTDPEIDLSGTAHGRLKIARRILNMDELCAMTEVRPRFELEIKLPGDSRGQKSAAFMFSIDGYLEGKALVGVLLGGECMLVQARGLKMAERIAREGLRDTVRFAKEEMENRSVIEVPGAAALASGLAVDVAGGRARPSEDGQLLKSDQLLRKILATEIGKVKWKQ